VSILAKLWGWFSGTSIGKYLIEGVVLIAAIGGLYAKVRLDGEHAQAAKDTEATLKDVQTAQKVQTQVANESDDAVKAELRKNWKRA